MWHLRTVPASSIYVPFHPRAGLSTPLQGWSGNAVSVPSNTWNTMSSRHHLSDFQHWNTTSSRVCHLNSVGTCSAHVLPHTALGNPWQSQNQTKANQPTFPQRHTFARTSTPKPAFFMLGRRRVGEQTLASARTNRSRTRRTTYDFQRRTHSSVARTSASVACPPASPPNPILDRVARRAQCVQKHKRKLDWVPKIVRNGTQ